MATATQSKSLITLELNKARARISAYMEPQSAGSAPGPMAPLAPVAPLNIEEPPLEKRSQKGTVLYLICVMFNSLQHASSKLALAQVGTYEVLQTRMLVVAAVSCTLLFYQREPYPVLGQPGERRLLFAVGAVGFCTICATYEALKTLTLPDVSAIGFIMPLCTLVIAAILLGERIVWQQIVCSFASLFGALVIARPTDLLSSGEGRVRGVLAALLSVLGTSASTVLLRKLKHAPPMQSVASYAVWSVVGSSVVVLYERAFAYPSTGRLWILIVLIAMFGFGFSWLQSLALQLEPASYLINFRYTQLVWSVVWELGLWGDWPDAWSIVGTCIVLVSAGVSTRYKG